MGSECKSLFTTVRLAGSDIALIGQFSGTPISLARSQYLEACSRIGVRQNS